MALGTLRFRSLARGAIADETPSSVRLRGEVEWIASGDPRDVDALVRAVGNSHADRASNDVVLLHFGNSVGRFVVGDLGSLVVQCGKWDEATFNALLTELTELALALPYAADQNAGLPHVRSLTDSAAILLHAFLYARAILLPSNRVEGLPFSMAAIFADPHRRFSTERVDAALVDAYSVDARCVARLLSGAAVAPVGGALARTRLARSLNGHLPTNVDIPRVRHSFDTVENRFVLGFLQELAAIIARVDALGREHIGHSFWDRSRTDCEAMRKALRPLLRQSLWEGVSAMSHVPVASSVLQRRRGYREVLRHHLLLRASTRFPNEDTLAMLLGAKDVAKLYELWCFFQVIHTLETILGSPTAIDRPHVDELQIKLPWGLRVAWPNNVAAYYNLEFNQQQSAMQRSVSLILRPDIVIQVPANSGVIAHVLDAKLRIDRPSKDEVTSFKWSDVAKMHAYRDALPAVSTAYVLYPGDEFEEFRVADGGVGAIPLVPGRASDRLVTHLRSILLLD